MKQPLRIGVLAPPWLRVPPETYGGTELVVDILCRGFKAAGHEPILFASGDSTCPVERISPVDHAEMPPDKLKEHVQIAALLERAGGLNLDLVHSHLEGLQPYASLLGIPVVTTLHVEVTKEQKDYLGGNQHVHYVAISRNQAKSFPFDVPTIHHGIELERYVYDSRKDSFFLFLGEVSRRKGADLALKAWMALASPLKIAGYLPPSQESWFRKDVLPRLEKGRLEFLGPVTFPEKVSLLSKARALLCPVRWEEPFGLVAIEAMASGTPVVAMRRGAFPELIENGVTGFLCDNEEEFMQAAARVDEINPADCRRRVEELFDSKRMVADYLSLFDEIRR